MQNHLTAVPAAQLDSGMCTEMSEGMGRQTGDQKEAIRQLHPHLVHEIACIDCVNDKLTQKSELESKKNRLTAVLAARLDFEHCALER